MMQPLAGWAHPAAEAVWPAMMLTRSTRPLAPGAALAAGTCCCWRTRCAAGGPSASSARGWACCTPSPPGRPSAPPPPAGVHGCQRAEVVAAAAGALPPSWAAPSVTAGREEEGTAEGPPGSGLADAHDGAINPRFAAAAARMSGRSSAWAACVTLP